MGANRYRNPDDDLPTDFSQKRDTLLRSPTPPAEADIFIEQMKEDMRKALSSLDKAMPRIRDKVRLLPNRKKKPISITPLDPQPEPRNLAQSQAGGGQTLVYDKPVKRYAQGNGFAPPLP